MRQGEPPAGGDDDAPLLELRDVTAGYAQDIDVLRDISLRVDAGRVTGLIGLNGAGKSTVVKTICGFLRAQVRDASIYDGEAISGIEPHRLIDRGICCIPQESSLFPYLSRARRTCCCRCRAAPKQLRRRHATRAARRCSSSSRRCRKSAARRRATCRAGSKSRWSSPRPGCSNRALCLIDEPSIGRRRRSRRGSVRLDREVRADRGMGILLIDHNVRRVVRMSDRIYVLSLGRITAAGAPRGFPGRPARAGAAVARADF